MVYLQHMFERTPGLGRKGTDIGSYRGSNYQQAPVTSTTDLPMIAMQHITQLLDPCTRRELRTVSKRWQQAVENCWTAIAIPVDYLKQHDLADLAGNFAGASCLTVSAAQHALSYSATNSNSRAEQLLAVALDNAVPWPSLTALDLTPALSSMTGSTVQILVQKLPMLQHLALPPVAADQGPHHVVGLLGQLPLLRSCQLDCSCFRGCKASPRGLHIPEAYTAASTRTELGQLQSWQDGLSLRTTNLQHLGTYNVQTCFEPVSIKHSFTSAAVEHVNQSSTNQITQHQCQLPTSNSGWCCLSSLQQLQHLQLSLAGCCVRGLVPALTGLQQLCNCSLIKIEPDTAAKQLLACSFDGSNTKQGLGQLVSLKHLTRLELGLESTAGSSSSFHGRCHLIMPPCRCSNMGSSISSSRTDPAPACSSYSCCWSQLSQLQALVLSGICLDSALIAATARCNHLTELRVAGFSLLANVAALDADFKGWLALRVLSVTDVFYLGPNKAAKLFPGLQELQIADSTNCCPALSCLKHHDQLRQLSITAAGSGWQLSALQLGYLVHTHSLRELKLASSSIAVHSGTANGSSFLPLGGLSHITCLTLSGPVTDHALSHLAVQFPGVKMLQLLDSYYVSDWGLKQLHKAPGLKCLLLQGCAHVTAYGLEGLLMSAGGVKQVTVNGCRAIDERACQRIRKLCRNSSAVLHWHSSSSCRCRGNSTCCCSTQGSQHPYARCNQYNAAA